MKINPTPVNDPKLRAVMANMGTHKIMICQNHPESQFSSKNPYQRSIFVLTTDCKCPVSDLLVINDGRTSEDLSDEEVANLMGTTIDDQRPEEIDVVAIILTDAVSAYPADTINRQLAKMHMSSMYGKHILHTPENENVKVLTHPVTDCAACGRTIMWASTDSDKRPMWRTAEITKANGLGTWCDVASGNITTTEGPWADYADIKRLDFLMVNNMTVEYGELYHKLASEYTEDTVVYQLSQYNGGITW